MKKIISIVTLLTLGATTVSYASIDKNLKYGQRDKEVTELQEFLIDKGLLKTTPSTYFGLLTFKAVKAYQTSIGVSSTGFVGVLTREKINKEIDTVIASSNEAEKAETGSSTNTTPTTQAVTNNTTTSSSDSIYDTDVKYDNLGRKIIITQSPNYKVVDYVVANLVDSNGKLVSGFFYKYKKLFVSNDEINARNTQTQNVQPTTTAVTDVCKNIEGTQSYVPSGMSVDSYGNCLTTQNTTTQQSNQNSNNPTQTNTTSQVVVPPVSVTPPDTSSFVSSLGSDLIKTFPNKTNVKIGSFTLKNNSTEIIQVTSLNVNLSVSGYSVTNLSNVTLKSEMNTIGSPVSNPSTVASFTVSGITVPVSGTKVFDVYADIGSASSGSVNITADITYKGSVSDKVKVLSSTGSQIATELMVTMNSTNAENPFRPLFLASNRGNVIAQFTVNADNSGKIGLNSITIDVSAVGVTNPAFPVGGCIFENISGSTGNSISCFKISGTKIVIPFGPDYSPIYEIEAGKSKKFNVEATFTGSASQEGVTPYLKSSLGTPDTFKWVDFQNGNSIKDGNSIIGYPTNSYETYH